MDNAFQKALAYGESLDDAKSKLEMQVKAEQQEKLRKINSDFSMARLINFILMTESKSSDAYRIAKTLLNQYRKATGKDKADRETKKILKSIQVPTDEEEKEGRKHDNKADQHKKEKAEADSTFNGSEESESGILEEIPEIEP